MKTTMKLDFHSLSTRGQARRLRALALEALKQYDLPVTRLRLITNDFNCIFRVDTADRRRLVLRVTMPEGGHQRASTEAEMAWLDALARETELTVPRPVFARDGAFVVEAAAEGIPQPRLVTIFTWVDGVNLADRITPETIAKMGQLMARLHQHAETFTPPNGDTLPRFDKVFPFPEPVVMFDPPYAHLFPGERGTLYRRANDWAQSAIDHLKAGDEPMRILHGDLHQWNVRIHRGRLAPIDFEDMMWGWRVEDIATTLYYFLDNDFDAVWRAFQSGYERLCPWPERYTGEIEALICARALMLVNFAIQDPSAYWQEHASAFSEKNELRLLKLFAHAER